MKIAVIAETAAAETRVAISPEVVKAYVKKGFAVTVAAGAGKGSFMGDDLFKEAGAAIAKDSVTAAKDADVVLCVRRPDPAVVKALKKGAVVAGILDPYGDKKPHRGAGQGGRGGVRHGTHAAHHPCPVDGCSVLAGQPCRLQGRG